MSNSTKDTLLLIDSFALIFRAYYAYPPTLTLADGKPINAVYGFTSLLIDVLQKFKPSHVIAIFDPGGPIIRQTEYVLYKANRKETDRELLDQIPLVQEVLQAFYIPVLKVDGYEADDVIATIDKRHSGNWARTIVVTGDQDLFQLVDEDTCIYLAGRKFSESKLFEESGVVEKLGIKPIQIPDYKALNGDPSDNIPGVKGIGKKTAQDLLQKFGTIEEIYENIGELTTKQQVLLSNSYDIAMQSKRLATVEPNVPISFDFKEALFKSFNVKKVMQYFETMRFRSLIKKIDLLSEIYTENENVGLFDPIEETIAQKTYDLFDVNVLKNVQTVFINGTYENLAKSPIHWMLDALEIKIKDKIYKINAEELQSFIENVEKNKVQLVGFDLKKIVHVIKNLKIDFKSLSLYDVGFASYLLAQGKASFKLESLSDFFGISMTLSDIEVVENLYAECNERFSEDREIKKLFELESNVLDVVIEMEQQGIIIDTQLLSEYESRLLAAQQELINGIYTDVGHEFNIGSPKQVSEVLFREKNLDGGKKTKSGSYSTNERVLRRLVGADPVVEKILKYREIDKLLSTYLRALPQYKDEDGKVHSIFDQFGAVSGRFASKNPNMQNIPINRDLDVNVRNAFVADEGNTFVAFDYSQQELRILAAIAGEQVMIDSFNNDEDIHKITAAELFDKTLDDVLDKERAFGKLVNFSVVYGVSAYGLSEQLQIPQEDSRLFISKYYNKYTSVKTYFDNQKEFARKNGYVETLFGRKRSSATINSTNRFAREAAERELLNFRIQGTAADIMKLAMIEISQILEKFSARLLLQIHDEFVFEIPESVDIDMFRDTVTTIMENVHNIGVKYKVNSAVAKRWGGLK